MAVSEAVSRRQKKASRPPAFVPGPLENSVKPFEVLALPVLPDTPEINDALRASVVACNGSVYLGADLEAQLRLIRFLRTRPDLASALGIGAGEPPAA